MNGRLESMKRPSRRLRLVGNKGIAEEDEGDYAENGDYSDQMDDEPEVKGEEVGVTSPLSPAEKNNSELAFINNREQNNNERESKAATSVSDQAYNNQGNAAYNTVVTASTQGERPQTYAGLPTISEQPFGSMSGAAEEHYGTPPEERPGGFEGLYMPMQSGTQDSTVLPVMASGPSMSNRPFSSPMSISSASAAAFSAHGSPTVVATAIYSSSASQGGNSVVASAVGIHSPVYSHLYSHLYCLQFSIRP